MRASLSASLTRTIAGVFVTVIRAFLNDVFGRSSIVLAALALWRRSPAAAYPAVAIGDLGHDAIHVHLAAGPSAATEFIQAVKICIVLRQRPPIAR